MLYKYYNLKEAGRQEILDFYPYFAILRTENHRMKKRKADLDHEYYRDNTLCRSK